MNLSLDPSLLRPSEVMGMMEDPQLSPTGARLTKINERATGAGEFSQFIEEDKNIIDMLNDDDEAGAEKFFQAIDMGELDEEEKQYLLIDKDTGRVYDLRNDTHLQRITSKNTRLTVDANNLSMSSSH